ncbi:MAG: peptidoglycan-binding protein [Firmicutes bacterium]|nr:peptidoglycan-binding protein [Bacillota bacterium]
MAKGTLFILVTKADESMPVENVEILVNDNNGKNLFKGVTDENGNAGPFQLDAPPREYTLTPDHGTDAYATYVVEARKAGYKTIYISGVEIVATEEAFLPIDFHPLEEGGEGIEYIEIPPPTCAINTPLPQDQEDVPPDFQQTNRANLMPLYVSPQASITEGEYGRADEIPPAPSPFLITPRHVNTPVFIPDFIRVRLGVPTNNAARIVRVRFIDYIKNSTSSEIYPTWPRNSLIANVHCIVSFALNRIFSEWYPSRGFAFDITNSTQFDQAFVYGRDIFRTISDVVDEYFNTFARRIGFVHPYFTEYCSGRSVTCQGLSQWGTVTLANQGRTPLQILHNFYPRDLELVQTNVVQSVAESFPGTPLRVGSSGPNVQRIQNFLNRIRTNFPAINSINPPNGVYGASTESAVRVFQRTFNLPQTGVTDRATWNMITRIYTGIIKMSELNGEGLRIGLSPNPPNVVVRQGMRGENVIHVQFILNYIAQFYASIPNVIKDANFGPATHNAVVAFQRQFGLNPDGVVGPLTWAKLYSVYRRLEQEGSPPTVVPTPPPSPPPPQNNPPFPGTLLREGSRSEDVRTMQRMLNKIRLVYPSIPLLAEDGVFGPITRSAVVAFQQQFLLNPDGIIGPITWAAIVREFNNVEGNVAPMPPPPPITPAPPVNPPPITPPPVTPPGLSGTVTTEGGNLNVRSAPNTGAPIIGSLPNGASVTITGEQNGWLRIIFQNGEGWISGQFVRINPTPARVTTQGGNLNMRSAPNTTSSVIATIPNGTNLQITGIEGDFFQTTFNGRTGFVSRQFVTI